MAKGEMLPMERIFSNSLGVGGSNPSTTVMPSGMPNYAEDEDQYQNDVAAMIEDAADYEESSLQYDREVNSRYYYGLEPSITGRDESDGTYESSDNRSEDEDAPSKSTAVSTDVRDTVMAIMPELMRIFTATEHALDFVPRSEGAADSAKQATDYIRYKFWDDNAGFTILHDAILDCLVTKAGIITWWTEDLDDVKVESFSNVTAEQIGLILSENETAEVVFQSPTNPQTGIIANVSIRFQEVSPQLRVEAVPPEEFRISRRARSVKTADLVGREQWVRAGDLIAMGYDPELVWMFAGDDQPWSIDEQMRNPYHTLGHNVTNDLVRYGTYYVRIDRDGDGMNELRLISTFGQNYFIADDTPVSDANYSVFSPSRVQHAVIGEAISDLTKDIQRISTNLLRGGLDSLAQSINPRTAVNETLTNIDDALNEDLGAIIRTKGDPAAAVYPIIIPFVGKEAFDAKGQMDIVRQRRTGISEASQGIDPKALQSTAVMGIDLIANGAQARIELIARIIAEIGLAPMYAGLLKEAVNNVNRAEMIQVRGEFVEVNPSTFDPRMRAKVNPALGKGSDMTRLMALQDVRNTQTMIIEKFGLNNGFVTVDNVRNTIVDMLAIANIRNVTRYFGEITEELKEAIHNAPREPSPEELLAQAELEKSKKDIVIATAEVAEDQRQADMKDDLERDKMQTKAFTDIIGIMAEFAVAEMDTETALATAKSYDSPEA